MKKELTANEKLDAVLRVLYQAYVDRDKPIELAPGKQFIELKDTNRKDLRDQLQISKTLLNQGIEIEQNELNLILGHLAYVEKLILEDHRVYNNIRDIIPCFRILYAGKILIENGGFAQIEKDKVAERSRIENAERRLGKHDFWIKAASIAAAVGAILFLFWDILKYLLEHYPLFPCFYCH